MEMMILSLQKLADPDRQPQQAIPTQSGSICSDASWGCFPTGNR